MTRTIPIFLALTVLATACSPVPSKATFTYFKASGTNAKTQFMCTQPVSRFRYALPSGMPHRIEVSFDDQTNSIIVSAFYRPNSSVQLDPSKVHAQVDGRNWRPVDAELGPVRTDGWGEMSHRALTARFDSGAKKADQVVVVLERGAIRIDGADFPLKPMVFNRITETKVWMQAVNC